MTKTKTAKDWQKQVKGLLKSELKKKDIGYKELSTRLKSIGVKESPENIANKISRGKFSMIFFIQCMEAIHTNTIRILDED